MHYENNYRYYCDPGVKLMDLYGDDAGSWDVVNFRGVQVRVGYGSDGDGSSPSGFDEGNGSGLGCGSSGPLYDGYGDGACMPDYEYGSHPGGPGCYRTICQYNHCEIHGCHCYEFFGGPCSRGTIPTAEGDCRAYAQYTQHSMTQPMLGTQVTGDHMFESRYCIVRCAAAGVHAGEVTWHQGG